MFLADENEKGTEVPFRLIFLIVQFAAAAGCRLNLRDTL